MSEDPWKDPRTWLVMSPFLLILAASIAVFVVLTIRLIREGPFAP